MNILKSYRLIRTKKVKYPIPEIPDDSEKKSGTDWVLPKIIGSGRVSGTRQALLITQLQGQPRYKIDNTHHNKGSENLFCLIYSHFVATIGMLQNTRF